MSAHPIGSIDLEGTVTCTLCEWTASDRLDPVASLGTHRDEAHPDAPTNGGTLTADWDGTVERDDRGDAYVGCTAWTGRPVLFRLTKKQAGELGRSLVGTPPARRHMPGVVLGAVLLTLFGFLTYTAWTAGGWWILAAGPTALMTALGAYGITSDAQRVPRDGRGRRTR